MEALKLPAQSQSRLYVQYRSENLRAQIVLKRRGDIWFIIYDKDLC